MRRDPRPSASLKGILDGINGRGYPNYRSIEGAFSFGEFTLQIDRVQRDPFAPPTLVRVFAPTEVTGLDTDLWSNRSRRVGLCDFLTRRLAHEIADIARGHRGTGNSGVIEVACPGQEIIERTSVQLKGDAFEARMFVGLPADGRRIKAGDAGAVLLEEVPEIVRKSTQADSLDLRSLQGHVDTNEDQDALRAQLAGLGLIGFIANGSVLPRQSGADDHPMVGDDVVRFTSPPSL